MLGRKRNWLLLSSTRSLSSSAVSQGRVKTRLGLAIKKQHINVKTKQEKFLQKQKEAKSIYDKKLEPVNFQKLLHQASQNSLSKEDLSQDVSSKVTTFLNSAGTRSVYKYLGTSGHQLKDPYVVAEDVRKYLDRDMDGKAILLCKLAKENAVVGMNYIFDYYIKNNKISMAFKSLRYRNIWGISYNSITYVLIFKAYGALPSLNEEQIKKVESIYQNLMNQYRNKILDKNYVNIAHINSALKALGNTLVNNQETAWKIFKSLPQSGPHSPNAQTYTIMINTLLNVTDQEYKKLQMQELLIDVCEKALNSLKFPANAKRFQIDLGLVNAMGNVTSRINNQKLSKLIVAFMRRVVVLDKYDLPQITISEENPIIEFLKTYKKTKIYPNKFTISNLIKLSSTDSSSIMAFKAIAQKNPLGLDKFMFRHFLGELPSMLPKENVGDEALKLVTEIREILLKNLDSKDSRTVPFINELFDNKEYLTLNMIIQAYIYELNVLKQPTKEISRDHEKMAKFRKEFKLKRIEIFKKIENLFNDPFLANHKQVTDEIKLFRIYSRWLTRHYLTLDMTRRLMKNYNLFLKKNLFIESHYNDYYHHLCFILKNLQEFMAHFQKERSNPSFDTKTNMRIMLNIKALVRDLKTSQFLIITNNLAS